MLVGELRNSRSTNAQQLVLCDCKQDWYARNSSRRDSSVLSRRYCRVRLTRQVEHDCFFRICLLANSALWLSSSRMRYSFAATRSSASVRRSRRYNRSRGVALGSAVMGVTVNTVDCVVEGTTAAAGGNETDVDEEASVVTAAAAAATLGGAIVLEIVVGAGPVTAVDVGVIVTLNAGCTNRFETSSLVLERLESDDAWAPVG